MDSQNITNVLDNHSDRWDRSIYFSDSQERLSYNAVTIATKPGPLNNKVLVLIHYFTVVFLQGLKVMECLPCEISPFSTEHCITGIKDWQ